VRLDPGTVEILREHAERQAKERERVGGSWPTDDWVFRMEMGTPLRTDLPGGGRRLVAMAQGICFTLVNGHVLYEHGKPTEARAGQVLRGS